MFNVLKQGLRKTREYLASKLEVLLSKDDPKADLLEDLEILLLQADLGIETTTKILANLSQIISVNNIVDHREIYVHLKQILGSILRVSEVPVIGSIERAPLVILVVGVNGVGKTTTIGKLANLYKKLGKKVTIACGDTFRAAAIEQLEYWGERLAIPVVKQSIGSDPSSVVFESYHYAIKEQQDVLIIDTAGRLHNKKNLMDQLSKIRRVLQKIDPHAPHETMLVLDGSIGQNSLNQVKIFNETVGISGITITKLDGTAKAGVLFAISDHFKIPIRYIGLGEGIDDLKQFSSTEFVEALFQ